MIDRLRYFVSHHRILCSLFLAIGLWLLARPVPTSIFAGLPVILLGEGIRTWSSGQIEKNKRLAKEGPYALTRNPLYLGNFFLGLGFSIMAGHWVVIAVFLPTFAFIYSATIRSEEETLARLFGSEFETYKREVPRFFPRLRSGRIGGQFQWSLVRKHREFNTWLGVVAGIALMAIKPLVFGGP
jgi:protein-S-isoprenylcysteine O-methyltransferase Ste14